MSLQVPVTNNAQGLDIGGLEVSEQVFGQDFNETLVHQLVMKFLADARAGTKAQKNRSAVSGGGQKPWRQKGTGRARSGTMRSPIWRTGGVTFAAEPRSYAQKLNKKMYRAGIRSILSELLRQGRLSVNDDVAPETPKTKDFTKKIEAFKGSRLLIITDAISNNLMLASRNIPYVSVATVNTVNPVSLISAEKVIATTAALKLIEERLS